MGVVGLAASVVYLHNRAEEEQDSEAVFCLSATWRPHLVEGAIHLGLGTSVTGAPDQLGVGGQPLQIETWREQQPEGFDRACEALAGAQAMAQPGAGDSGGWSDILTFLNVVLPVVAVLLTLWLTLRLDAGGVRRLQAETLRSASLRFHQAAENYLRQRSGGSPGDPPPVDALYESRAELAAQLRQISALHQDWTYPIGLQRRLAGDLGGDLVGRPGPIIPEHGDEVLAALRSFADAVEHVALAHSSGGRRSPEMRDPVAA
jgi:hypothetical protein